MKTVIADGRVTFEGSTLHDQLVKDSGELSDVIDAKTDGFRKEIQPLEEGLRRYIQMINIIRHGE